MEFTLKCPKCKRDVNMELEGTELSMDSITFCCPHCDWPGMLNYAKNTVETALKD